VAIARALAAEPRVLLLDEPLAALDVQTAARARQLLRDQVRQPGLATVFVTHDAVDAVAVADRVAVLHDGRIVAEGEPADVLGRPRDAFTAALAGLNFLPGAAVAGAGAVEIAVEVGADGSVLVHGETDGRLGPRAAAVFRPSAVTVTPAPGPVDPVRVSSSRPSGAVTELPAHVIGLEAAAGGALVRLGLGATPRVNQAGAASNPSEPGPHRVPELLAELPYTEAAALVPGRAVHVMIPAAAVRLVDLL